MLRGTSSHHPPSAPDPASEPETERRHAPADGDVERLILAALTEGGVDAARAVVEAHDAPFLDGPGSVKEVGRRVKSFADLCHSEVLPRVVRLHEGLTGIAAAAGDPGRAAWRESAITYWPRLRAEITALFHDAWLTAHRAAGLYARLAPHLQAEAERRFGPISDGPGQFSALWHAHWPARELARADERARAAGLPGAPRAAVTPHEGNLPADRAA